MDALVFVMGSSDVIGCSLTVPNVLEFVLSITIELRRSFPRKPPGNYDYIS